MHCRPETNPEPPMRFPVGRAQENYPIRLSIYSIGSAQAKGQTIITFARNRSIPILAFVQRHILRDVTILRDVAKELRAKGCRERPCGDEHAPGEILFHGDCNTILPISSNAPWCSEMTVYVPRTRSETSRRSIPLSGTILRSTSRPTRSRTIMVSPATELLSETESVAGFGKRGSAS